MKLKFEWPVWHRKKILTEKSEVTEKCRWTSISRDVFGTCQGEHNRNGLALALAALYEETPDSKGFDMSKKIYIK